MAGERLDPRDEVFDTVVVGGVTVGITSNLLLTYDKDYGSLTTAEVAAIEAHCKSRAHDIVTSTLGIEKAA